MSFWNRKRHPTNVAVEYRALNGKTVTERIWKGDTLKMTDNSGHPTLRVTYADGTVRIAQLAPTLHMEPDEIRDWNSLVRAGLTA